MDIRSFLSNYADTTKLKNKYNESVKDIKEMFDIQTEFINSSKPQFILNATECTYISPPCLIILSSLQLICLEQQKKLTIKLKYGSKLDKLLKHSGFIQTSKISNSSVPFTIIHSDDEIEELITKIVELSPLKNEDKTTKQTIISRLYELPANSIEHSKNNNGVLCCAYYTTKKEFCFCIYDLGIGIPNSVREHKNNKHLSSKEALEWALKESHTTMTSYPRGLGFTTIEEFRKKYNGTFKIITENVMYSAIHTEKKIKNFNKTIRGTLFMIKIMV